MSKIGRNDPCACGSGRKFKFCCGALRIDVAPTAAMPGLAPTVSMARPGPMPVEAPPRPADTIPRGCGPCTRCCDGWLPGEIHGHRMHPGQRCHYVGDAGCTIYDERPQTPCRSFVCGWMQPGSALPDDWRPDRIGVVVVTTRWRDAPALILVSAGNDPGEPVLDWLRAHARAHNVPFFYESAGERYGYGPVEFQREMAARVARGEKLW